jgi:hypothetical protein
MQSSHYFRFQSFLFEIVQQFYLASNEVYLLESFVVVTELQPKIQEPF